MTKHPMVLRPTAVRLVAAAAAALLGLSASGCVVVRARRPDPISPEEVIRLSEEGVAPEEIIAKIRASRTVYRVDAEDVVRLSERGVDKKVIDYMMETERRERERRASYYYDPYFYGPYWYWRPYYHGRFGFCW